MLEEAKNEIADSEELGNIYIEILKNKNLLKDIFLNRNQRFILEEVDGYRNFVEGRSETNISVKLNRSTHKIKENLIFNNLNSVVMKHLINHKNFGHLMTNIHYYKQYLKVYDNFYSQNFHHLQILRVNYLMSRTKVEQNEKESILQVNGIKKQTNQSLIKLFENYLNVDAEAQIGRTNKSPTYVLTILSSTIVLFNTQTINKDILLRCLDNLVFEFKTNLSNNDNFLNLISYEVVSAIEDNLNLLLDLINSHIFFNKEININLKFEVFSRLINLMKYYKSQNILIRLLVLMKEFNFNYKNLEDVKNIFSYENELTKIISFKQDNFQNFLQNQSDSTNSFHLYSILNYNDSKVLIDSENLKQLENINLLADEKYLYLFFKNYVVKIGQGYEDALKDKVYSFIRLPEGDENLVRKSAHILKGNCLYVLSKIKNKLRFVIIDKNSFEITSDLSENVRGKIKRIFNDDEYFYLILKVNTTSRGMISENTTDEDKYVLHRIKTKKYYQEKFGLLISEERQFNFNMSDILSFVKKNKKSDEFYSHFFNEICIVNAKAKSNWKIMFDLNKATRFANIKVSCLEASNFWGTSSYSIYFNVSRNTILITETKIGSEKSLIKINHIKVFATNPYKYNFLNKSFLKEKVINKEITQKYSSQENKNLTSCLICHHKQKYSSGEKTTPNKEYYLIFLYYFTNYLLNTSNSKLFNFTINGKTLPDIIKKITTPFSFGCDIKLSIFTNLFEKIFTVENYKFDEENLFYLVIVKNFLQNLSSLGVDIVTYFISGVYDLSKADLLQEFVNQLISHLFILNNNNEDKILTLFFNEILDILKILLNQNYPLKSEVFLKLIEASKNFDKKLKIISLLLNILNSSKGRKNNVKLDKEFEEFLLYILKFEREILFQEGNLDKLNNYLDLISDFTDNFKSFFLRNFNEELLSTLEESCTTNSNSTELLNKLFEIFSGELTEILQMTIQKKEETIWKSQQRKSNFIRFIENNSLNFNITYMLIQIYIAIFMRTKKNFNKEFPFFYFNKVINLYILLDKLSEVLNHNNINYNEVNKEIFYSVESDHPLIDSKERKIDLQLKTNNKANITFDILSNTFSSTEVNIQALKDKKTQADLKFNKKFPCDTIHLENMDLLDISISLKSDGKKSSDKFTNFIKEYGFKIGISLDSNKDRNADLFSEMRRCVLYSINIIIGENLQHNTNIDTVETKMKDNILYKSVFNSKLMKYISLSDTHTFIKRENINFINQLIQNLKDDTIRNEISYLFKNLQEIEHDNQTQSEYENNLEILRTYSKEVNYNLSLQQNEQSLIESILSDDPIFAKGIKYLQKVLKLKNTYLASLGGKEIEVLVLHIFVIVLKYQNLVNLYEKFINEISLLERNNEDIKTEEIHKIENFELFLKIWTECSKIRIWFLERKMIIAENLEKGKVNEVKNSDYDQEVSLFILNLVSKSKFFLSIINNKENSQNAGPLFKPNSLFSQEIIDSVLLCIKTEEISLEKITERINNKNGIGIKRETGLILMNIILNLISVNNETDINDFIYHFNKVMKQDNKVINLIDDLIGADYKVIERVNMQFHLLMKNLMDKCLSASGITQIYLMQSLVWRIKGRDYPILKNLNLFENLTKKLLNKNLNNNVTKDSTYTYETEIISADLFDKTFFELFEVYALQIFRKINEFRNRDNFNNNNTNNSLLNLTRSTSNVSEDDSKKLLESVINVLLEIFGQFSLDIDKDEVKLKKYLNLLYRCIGYNPEIVQTLNNINPDLFVVLFKLFNHPNISEALDIKFLLIKIYHQYISSINKIDYDLFNYVVQNVLKDKNSFDDFNTEISSFYLFLQYYFNLIYKLKNNAESKDFVLIFELIDLFKVLFLFKEEPFKSDLQKFLQEKLQSDISTLLFIINTNIDTTRVGAQVYVKCGEPEGSVNKTTKEFNLEDLNETITNENSTDGNSLPGYKLGRIIGFSPTDNPFENKDGSTEFNPSDLYFSTNGTINSYACIILEESLDYQIIKNTSYEIITKKASDLILNTNTKEIDENVTNFLIENKFIQLILNNIICKASIPLEKKYTVLKFLYTLLDTKNNNLQDELLNEINNNPQLFLLLLNSSFDPLNLIEDNFTKIKYNVKFNYFSLEYLEEKLRNNILANSYNEIKNEYDQEFFELFNFSFNFDEKISLKIKHNQITQFSEIILCLNNSTISPLINYSTNKLSLFRTKETERILNKNSIMFVESKNLLEEKDHECIYKIIKEFSISCIITENSLLKDFTQFSDLKIPVMVASQFNFFSLVSYFFFIEEDDSNSLNFRFKGMISIEESGQDKISKKVYEFNFDHCEDVDPDAMIFFPGEETESIIININEDHFKANRDIDALFKKLSKFKLHLNLMMRKLSSLLCRRILIKLLSNYRKLDKLANLINSILIDNLILLYKSISYEHLLNLNFSHYELSNFMVRNLIREFILSLDKCNPISKTLYSYLLNLNDIQKLSTEKNYAKLITSDKLEFDILTNKENEFLEVNVNTIMFILKNNFDNVDEINKIIFLKEFILKITECPQKISGKSCLYEILKVFIKLIYSKIHDLDFINILRENVDLILPLENIKLLLPICQNMLSDVKENKIKIKKQETDIVQFFFTYFDVIFYLCLNYNISCGVSFWLTTKLKIKILSFYYIYLIFTRKFNYDSKDYLTFLTLFNYREKLNLVFNIDDDNNTSIKEFHIENKFKYSKDSCVSMPLLKKIKMSDFDSVSISVYDNKKENLTNSVYTFDKNYNLQDYYTSSEFGYNNPIYFKISSQSDKFYYTTGNTFSNPNDITNTFSHKLFSFGKNANHALCCEGDLDKEFGEPQMCLGLDENVNIKAFKFGYHHTFVLDYNGTLYVAGKGEGSSLKQFSEPIGSFTKDNQFNEIAKKEGGVKNIFVNNYNSSIMLTNSNKLFGCGKNSCCNLSNKMYPDNLTHIPYKMSPLPEEALNVPIAHVALGYKNSMVILENGVAYSLGDNKYYQTGNCVTQDNMLNWFKMPLPENCRKFVSAAAGELYFLILLEDNQGKTRLYSIGNFEFGRSGVGEDRTFSFRQCKGVEHLEFKYVSSRNCSSAAISKDGKLYTFGDNTNGCLGLGINDPHVWTPKLVEFFSNQSYIVDSVSIGYLHMIVLARKLVNDEYVKAVFTCGTNEFGSMGFTDFKLISNEPKEVEYFNTNELVPVRIFSSKYQSYVMTIPKNYLQSVYTHFNTKCNFCKKENLRNVLTFSVDKYENFNLLCSDCLLDKKIIKQNFQFSMITPVNNTKVSELKEIVTKHNYIFDNQLKYVSVSDEETLEFLIKENSGKPLYLCSDCGKDINPPRAQVFISTENFDLVLCYNCISTHSSLIEHPQIFYTLNQVYLNKAAMSLLPKLEFSKLIYNITKTSDDPYFKVNVQLLEKQENSLFAFYNSDKVFKMLHLMKKIDLNVLTDFSILRDEVISSSGNKQPEVEEIIKYLLNQPEAEKFPLIRGVMNLGDSMASKLMSIMKVLIKKINKHLFRLISISQYTDDSSLLTSAIRENTNFISSKNRIKMFYDKLGEIAKSAGSSGKEVRLNRYKAKMFYEKETPDLTGTETIFGQLFNSMKNFEVKKYCCLMSQRIFTVNLVGEGATDAGGPYRDVFSSVCEELHSPCLDLFIKTPNNKTEVGSFRDRFIPNPSANLEVHYNMYNFIGLLFGNAVCSGNLLNLNIHPIVWKLLLLSEVKFSDYETVDTIFFKLISDIEKTSTTSHDFEYYFDLNFTTQLSNGTEVELVPGGKYISVNYENKDKFIQLAKTCRINEFNNQIKFIREGFNKVVNNSLLQFLTWRELEELVCGKPSLNIEHLKSKTSYTNCSKDDQVIIWFWEVLQEFKDEEKVLYLKFVWGKSRLPDPEVYNFTHTINRLDCSGPDKHLPQAGTCYFTLKLPRYNSKNILAEKLRYVIHNCNEIDTDFAAAAIQI